MEIIKNKYLKIKGLLNLYKISKNRIIAKESNKKAK
jgi:hypothetical protein